MLAVALSVATGVTGGGGCSLMFAKGPPERVERGEPIRCTKSYALPAVDGLITVFQVVRTLYAVSLSDRDYQGMDIPREADIGLGLFFSGLFLMSTAVGASRVGGCNALLEGTERRSESRRRPARPSAPPRAAGPDPFAEPSRPAGPDPFADEAPADGTSAAGDPKAAGEAVDAAAPEPKPEVVVPPQQ
jgi:hypothetical protein